MTVFLCAAGHAAAGNGADKGRQTLSQQLDEVFADWNRTDRPGGVALVTKNGKVVYEKGFGLASLEQRVPNSDVTLLDVGALAEPVVGMAVALLETRGKLSLDQPVEKYIPGLPRHTRPLLLRHLLFHESGLWDWELLYEYAGDRLQDVITFQDVLALLRTQKRLAFAPGTEYSYSRTNVDLLVRVVEKVTGEQFRDWAWHNLFKPLGMPRTRFRVSAREVFEHRAQSYNFDSNEGYLRGAESSQVIGASGLYTSCRDLSRWLVNLETAAVGGRAVADKLLVPANANAKKPKLTYGFTQDQFRGHRRLLSANDWAGFRSAIAYFPDQRLGIAVIANWDYRFHAPTSHTEQVAELFLPPAQAQPVGPGHGAPAAAAPIAIAPERLAELEGDFRVAPGFVARFTRKESSLALVLEGGGEFVLTAVSPTSFRLDAFAWSIEFQADKKGRYDKAVVRQDGEPELVAERITRAKPTKRQLQALAGTYELVGLGTRYRVELRGGVLFLVPPSGKELALTPEARDHFQSGSRLFPLLRFERNRAGRITGISVRTGGAVTISLRRR